MSDAPRDCQLCNEPLESTFVDGLTTVGVWAIMCPKCHSHYGKGFGTGRGSLHSTATGAKLPAPEGQKGRAA